MDYKKISNLYEELVGIHKKLFQETVIQRAKRIFCEDANIAEQVLEELVDTVSWLTPREIPFFLQTVICDETFSYQYDRGIIQRERHRNIDDFVFHINNGTFLDSVNGELVPQHILDDKPFDPEDYEDYDTDYYRVCFAQGSLGDLSVYLAGHVFLNCSYDLAEVENEKELDPNSHYFAQNYKIAVVDFANTRKEPSCGVHTIETTYFGDPGTGKSFRIPELDNPENMITMRESNDRTPLVTVLRIPYTIWTRDQIKACEDEAKKYRNERIKNIDLESGYVPKDEDSYVRLFVAEKKFEHQILYALHSFIDQRQVF